MPDLSPPSIVPPLSACAMQVRLRGQVTGATVRIYAQSVSGVQEELFEGAASGPDEVFTITRRLKARETVYATQELPTDSPAPLLLKETVEPEPDPSELGVIVPDAHLHACASCAPFGNGLPGADVVITSSTRSILGSFTRGRGQAEVDPLSGAARVHFDPGPLVAGEILEAQQFICAYKGPVSVLPTLDVPANTGGRLSAPTIKEPLIACERAVLVENVEAGAIVTLYRDGAQDSTACFDYPSLYYRLAEPLKEKEHITVDQSFPRCQLTSPPSKEAVVGPASSVPKPTLDGPFCKGTTQIGVSNLHYGARIQIIQTAGRLEDGYPVANAEAWDESCDIPLVNPLDPADGRWLFAVQSLCAQDSPPSDRAEVYVLDSNLPAPWILGPLYECSRMVRVAGIEPGARIEIFSVNKRPTLPRPDPTPRRIAVRQVHARVADIPVAPALQYDHEVFVRQTACNQTADSWWVEVEPIGDLKPPTIEECDDHLDVTGVLPGARVEVFLNGAFFKEGRSGSSVVRIPLDAPLKPPDVVKARQFMCSKISVFGPDLPILEAVEKRGLRLKHLTDSGDPRYTEDDRFGGVIAERICTLSAPSDPEPDRYPIQNNCAAAGIFGADLGIVIDHDTGDGLLYFFFGDTYALYPFDTNRDVMARTSASVPGPYGPALEFLYEERPGQLLAPPSPLPLPCNIPEISQFAYEVPTGGFSHAGKLYIFFTTDAYDRPDRDSGHSTGMGRSVLAAASDWRDDFEIVPGHKHISTRLGAAAGNFKFINIAPWKIRNDDWPCLPDNALPGGEGLILMGSGDYCESNTCLAYVPLPPGRDPVWSEWRYLSGFTPSRGLNCGPCGNPLWSPSQADAMFLWGDTAHRFVWPPQPSTFSTPTPSLGDGPVDQLPYTAGAVGELSIAFIPQVRLWVALYRDMALRCAPFPWGPWSEPIWLFRADPRDSTTPYPSRDNADPSDLSDPRPRFLGPDPYIYGPYLIQRFTEYEPVTGALTLYYVMSTQDPYASMLMRTTLDLQCGYNANFLCPAWFVNYD